MEGKTLEIFSAIPVWHLKQKPEFTLDEIPKWHGSILLLNLMQCILYCTVKQLKNAFWKTASVMNKQCFNA